jgi:hypothetical protein
MQSACAILSSVAYPSVHYFSTVSHKWHDFGGGGGKLLNIKCVFWYAVRLLSEIFLILRKMQRDIINVYRS